MMVTRLTLSLRTAAVVVAGFFAIDSAQGQTAYFGTIGSPCDNPVGPEVQVSATLPVPGWDLTWRVTGQTGAYASLLLDTSYNYFGISLTPYGLTDCVWRLGNSPVAVPMWLGLTGTRTHTIPLPGNMPLGMRIFGQAVMAVNGANPAGAVVSQLGNARIGSEPNLTTAEILGFAPVVRIHPSETYFPMNPLDFIALSRFRHHRGWQSDQGYNKVTQTWVTTNSTAAAYYDIPVAFINGYGLNSNGTNRRPNDPNSGSSWNVFLQPNGAPVGDHNPNGSAPAFYHYRRSGSLHEIQYWWFMGYNDAPATINHQGDWEHVTVHVEQRQIVGVHFASHNSGAYYPRSQVAFTGGRPVVYMAKGTHASYPTAGSHHYGIDQTANGGYQWDIHSALSNLGSAPWKDYAGAWGEVGTTSTTTGPLGPWHKRNDP